MEEPAEDHWTKRKILKVFPRLFDPLGLVLPYVMTARCIFSRVARHTATWDEKLSPDRLLRWLRWVAQLPELGEVRVPRCIKKAATPLATALHVFCDASSEAYCAVAYLQVGENNGETSVRLVLARGKVAPPKRQSIPRLELLACALGLEVGAAARAHLKMEIKEEFFWTDSLNVLFWLRNETRRLQTFVDNQVRKIKVATALEQWRWVPTDLNPADLPTVAFGGMARLF